MKLTRRPQRPIKALKRAPYYLASIALLYIVFGIAIKHGSNEPRAPSAQESSSFSKKDYYENFLQRLPVSRMGQDSISQINFETRAGSRRFTQKDELGKTLVPARSGHEVEPGREVLLPVASSFRQWERSLSTEERWSHSLAATMAFVSKLVRMGFKHPVVPFSWRDWHDTSEITKTKVSGLSSEYFEVAESEAIKAARGARFLYLDGVAINKMVVLYNESCIELNARNLDSRKSAIFDPESGMLSDIRELESQRGPAFFNMSSVKQDISLNSQDHQSASREPLPSNHEDSAKLHPTKPISLPKIETRRNFKYHGKEEGVIELIEEDFDLDLSNRIEEMSQISICDEYNGKNITVAESAFLQHLAFRHTEMLRETSRSLNEKHQTKFFNEVKLDSKDREIWGQGCHHDWRFFRSITPQQQRLQVLHRMTRAWQSFASHQKIIYWLAHGNLLSWFWQGTNFEWDYDIDIQVPMRHMEFLSANFNNSIIISDDEGYVGRYYLEVNPLYADKNRGSGMNVIDARFIDVDTGLYIDLTSISNVVDSAGSHFGDKNYHSYQSFSYLNPLRETMYEGSKTYIPAAVQNILSDEYPSGLSKMEYKDYVYNKTISGWISNSKNPNMIPEPLKIMWKRHQLEIAALCPLEGFKDTKSCKDRTTSESGKKN
ncbi:KLTH0D11220p [Lachancea thermotolerans CBS 6340]|uniref:KLTH0D11220p n=1 Tax=Lachancea thermotolerans (strain ATCC 56472 / CBS 6340 / NRRL Y-8284) TaxID=559295 RepID=C5DF04_LACTC|nr:KLTH0D11220p [Lachancea thermotolerans CBS 6340]CAR22759.1 KLTH0D11220p [Lachancea thermotolerans CBS 6340]